VKFVKIPPTPFVINIKFDLIFLFTIQYAIGDHKAALIGLYSSRIFSLTPKCHISNYYVTWS